MKIFLTETWRIEKVRRNYVLKHAKLTTGTGKNKGLLRMITVDEGGYTSVEKALEAFKRKIVEDETSDFEGNIDEYISRIRNILNAADEKMKGMVKAWEQDT